MTNLQRANFVAFACGKRGSGKSYLLDRYAAKFPRRIIIDPLGEYFGNGEPDAQECGSLAQVLDALEANILMGRRAWTIIACIEAKDVAVLCGVLAPVGEMQGGYSRAVGGVCLMCGEVDTIAPNNASIAPEVRNILQRGRHYRVSFLAGTQRPRDTHRVVTSQADVLCIFRQHELRDLDYISKITSAGIARRVRELPVYTHVRYLPNSGDCSIVAPEGNVISNVSVFDGGDDAAQLPLDAPEENDDA